MKLQITNLEPWETDLEEQDSGLQRKRVQRMKRYEASKSSFPKLTFGYKQGL